MADRLPIPRPSSGLQRRVQKDLMQITVETGLSALFLGLRPRHRPERGAHGLSQKNSHHASGVVNPR